MAMATTAALSLKELRSIIELSSASRARTGGNATGTIEGATQPLKQLLASTTPQGSRGMSSLRSGANDFPRTTPQPEESFRGRSGTHIKLC
jgi:hypothetical protein